MNALVAYSRFISRYAGIVLVVMLLLTVGAFQQMRTVTIEDQDFDEYFPDLPAIAAFKSIEDAFGSTNSAQVAIFIEPNTPGSNEPRDVRDPRVLSFAKTIEAYATNIEGVSSVSGAASLYESANAGALPRTLTEVKEVERGLPTISSYVSQDKSVMLVSLRLEDDADSSAIHKELTSIISTLPRLPGVTAEPAGGAMQDPAVHEVISKDMNTTSMYSLIGILFVMLAIFTSIRYGLIPLMTILFGTVWTMGFIGFAGMHMSSATSGVISMIMGIGIDFGIQVTNRYRQERKRQEKEAAMTTTLEKVIVPMLITTLAACIGFWSMGQGSLTLLGEMGKMMMYGTICCFFAAITIVPSTLLVLDWKKGTRE